MWETVIGLEVHVQLATKSKIFSGSHTAFGAEPNTQACIIDLGFPGVLPVLNKEAVAMAIRFALSVNADIPPYSVFARKNYFYPDLPKGYQISQFTLPIVGNGQLKIFLEDGQEKNIRITRAHLEEDAGKSMHEGLEGLSGIDLNRAGTPLLEVVSEPDMRSAKEAVAYLKTLHALVRYLEICDGNMQEGSFRCDANVSIRRMGDPQLGTRTEIKNVNSFRFVEKAIQYEVQRQIGILENGGKIRQETRLYDADKNETRAMRSKEEANDYRYFTDPDLLPLHVSPEFIASIAEKMPELPHQKKERFIAQYGVTAYDANILASERALADYFEAVIAVTFKETSADLITVRLIVNWIVGDLLAALNKSNLDVTHSPVSPKQLAALIQRIVDNTISGKIAKTVFEAIWHQEGEVDQVIETKGLTQIVDDTAIETCIDTIIAENTTQVLAYRAGKEALFGFFVGQVMKATQGKANPKLVNEWLKKKLAQK